MLEGQHVNLYLIQVASRDRRTPGGILQSEFRRLGAYSGSIPAHPTNPDKAKMFEGQDGQDEAQDGQDEAHFSTPKSPYFLA